VPVPFSGVVLLDAQSAIYLLIHSRPVGNIADRHPDEAILLGRLQRGNVTAGHGGSCGIGHVSSPNTPRATLRRQRAAAAHIVTRSNSAWDTLSAAGACRDSIPFRSRKITPVDPPPSAAGPAANSPPRALNRHLPPLDASPIAPRRGATTGGRVSPRRESGSLLPFLHSWLPYF
jgi:hypothetical protein